MIYVRKCEIDGAIMVSSDDFSWHGIKHSSALQLTEEQFKILQRLQKGVNHEKKDSITLGDTLGRTQA